MLAEDELRENDMDSCKEIDSGEQELFSDEEDLKIARENRKLWKRSYKPEWENQFRRGSEFPDMDLEEAYRRAKALANRTNISITKRHSRRDSTLTIRCSRAGQKQRINGDKRERKTSQRRNRGTIKCGCPFKIILKKVDNIKTNNENDLTAGVRVSSSFLQHNLKCNPSVSVQRYVRRTRGKKISFEVLGKLQSILSVNPDNRQFRAFLETHGLTALGTTATELRNLRLRVHRAATAGYLNSATNENLGSLKNATETLNAKERTTSDGAKALIEGFGPRDRFKMLMSVFREQAEMISNSDELFQITLLYTKTFNDVLKGLEGKEMLHRPFRLLMEKLPQCHTDKESMDMICLSQDAQNVNLPAPPPKLGRRSKRSAYKCRNIAHACIHAHFYSFTQIQKFTGGIRRQED